MNLYNFDFRKFIDKIEDSLTVRSRLFTGYLCNIKCKFCFYRDKEPTDIKDKIHNQINIAKEYGIKDWDISGGEPTILPYWFNLLDDLKKDFRKIAVITNGYKFSDLDFLQKSIDHGLNEVLFSLHGPNEQIHDGMTGVKGSFKKVSNAINNAIKLGILIRINTVVTKDNYKYLNEIATIINTIKPNSFNFLPFRIENYAKPEGNALDPSESAKYIKEAIDILKDKNIIISVRYIPFCLMIGYEKYVCNYLQRMFDPFDWSENIIRNLDCIRRETERPEIKKQSFESELEAVFETIKLVAGFKTSCLKCKNLFICDGIWKTNATFFGIESYSCLHGEKITDILKYKREN